MLPSLLRRCEEVCAGPCPELNRWDAFVQGSLCAGLCRSHSICILQFYVLVGKSVNKTKQKKKEQDMDIKIKARRGIPQRKEREREWRKVVI